MKVTLHTDHDGNLMVYVPKKDLEEPVCLMVGNSPLPDSKTLLRCRKPSMLAS